MKVNFLHATFTKSEKCCLSKEHSCKKTKQWKSDHKMVLFDYITLILIWKIYSIDIARWLRKV